MVKIRNASSTTVTISIDEGPLFSLRKGESTSVSLIPKKQTKISLSHNKMSYKKRNIANLLVTSTYSFHEMDDNATLIVKRERIRFDLDASYDCFFLMSVPTHNLIPEYRVEGIDLLKESFRRSQILDTLFVDPILDFAFYDAFVYIVAFYCAWTFGIKYLFIFLIAGYLINLVIRQIIDKLSNILNPDAKEENILNRIDYWCSHENIDLFFSDPNREPIIGKVEN